MKGNLQSAQATGAPESRQMGDRWSRYCGLDQDGTIVEEDRVRTSAEGLEQRFGKTPAMRIVIEAGRGCGRQRTQDPDDIQQ